MYKSYYFLNRYILELKSKIVNKIITSVFSQEKDKLIIQLNNGEVDYLELSVNPSVPYFNFRHKFSRARKNTLDFFIQLTGAVVKDLLIASDDRIILISTSKGEIYFTIRGQFTNVYFVSEKHIESFKKVSLENLESLRTEFADKYYLNHFNLLAVDDLQGKTLEQIKKEFPFIGRDITNEVKLLTENDNYIAKSFINVLEIIQSAKPAIFRDESAGTIQIGFDNMKIFSGMKKEYFDNIITAFNYFLSNKYSLSEELSKQKIIKYFLDKELKKVTNKLNSLQTVIEKGLNEEELNKFANLLLINLDKLKPGDKEVDLQDIYNNNKSISIKLNPKLSPDQNVKWYFDKARDNRINYEKSIRLKTETQKYFEKLKQINVKFNNAKSLNDLDFIMDELKIKDENNDKHKVDLSSKFKHYLIENKYHIYVGKDSTNNDLLTTKFAKQNDFWFHARSVSGSHVIIRVQNTKEAIPKNILKQAASLAAYHSKAKTAGLVPVSYTLKKYVIKRKGMPAGQVSLMKEDILLVKPEIPKNCEYLQNDLI